MLCRLPSVRKVGVVAEKIAKTATSARIKP
jgi:hypothetical protein